jgi:hypothetical protein
LIWFPMNGRGAERLRFGTFSRPYLWKRPLRKWIMIAQASSLNLPFITFDKLFASYGLSVIS